MTSDRAISVVCIVSVFFMGYRALGFVGGAGAIAAFLIVSWRTLKEEWGKETL